MSNNKYSFKNRFKQQQLYHIYSKHGAYFVFLFFSFFLCYVFHLGLSL
ncbi:unnamed protein product [Phytomonas sp. Hart1]|nr:unnamed protein product [Phytomonas sp. Hart1]|eukprot:CCW70552.1 unnamed protein product [Phytomonas sp. isolate Hart1]